MSSKEIDLNQQKNITVQTEKSLEYFKRYSNTLSITAGCRFEASRRLDKKDGVSAVTISTLSLYAISFSLAPYFIDVELVKSLSFLPFVSVIISIFIIILTLLEASKKYSVRAEMMHQCGKALNELHYELDYLINTGNINETRFHQIKESYDKVIKNFPENHEQLDFHYYRVTHPRRFFKKRNVSKQTSNKNKYFLFSRLLKWFSRSIEVVRIILWHQIRMWGFYATLMVIPIFIIGAQYYLNLS